MGQIIKLQYQSYHLLDFERKNQTLPILGFPSQNVQIQSVWDRQINNLVRSMDSKKRTHQADLKQKRRQNYEKYFFEEILKLV